MATSGLDFYLEREIALTVVERWITFKEQRNLVQVEEWLKSKAVSKDEGKEGQEEGRAGRGHWLESGCASKASPGLSQCPLPAKVPRDNLACLGTDRTASFPCRAAACVEPCALFLVGAFKFKTWP